MRSPHSVACYLTQTLQRVSSILSYHVVISCLADIVRNSSKKQLQIQPTKTYIRKTKEE